METTDYVLEKPIFRLSKGKKLKINMIKINHKY